ncbi:MULTISPECIES: NAD(P)/FAD-dependent oxidoreductase [Asticcacaulis]|uniref:NAD(P)/FAD-dependent oxidoreductase n=1 Tax=Asticcacaulis TaxID=76890 RepID=UPI001AEB99FC|nr:MULTISPECIES: NAD(P)/FAD-dependent oxidoreductase [Asticcacaulis]MBP2161877.1 L-2-hydroxyglutarate oxidase LhgO [Asticcacaulis solisilvae]MDR6802923.1 L-2-hydroxyglutarate oxidase LhgO [Asticcacaulis sp. BE141]
MTSSDFDATVIGAGVIGLSIARELAQKGLSVLLIEKTDGIGRGISSRNSEVIHAGIYYERDSLKTRFCTRGRDLLYAYLKERGIPHKKCGKLIVAASESQLAGLKALRTAGIGNGVPGLEILSRDEVADLEPDLTCVAAMLSPETGIIDSHAYMLALQGDLENAGGVITFFTPFVSAHFKEGVFHIVTGEAELTEITSRWLINAGGLWASEIARAIENFSHTVPPLYYAKGSYFTYTGSTPFSRLIYPMPEPGGLGVHLTLDLQNRGRFGPDVQWIDAIDFTASADRRDAFVDAISTYWPEIRNRTLSVDFCGIRPKLSRKNEPTRDFLINGPEAHNGAHLIQLFGIESPGLTSSLAIAEYVSGLVTRD